MSRIVEQAVLYNRNQSVHGENPHLDGPLQPGEVDRACGVRCKRTRDRLPRRRGIFYLVRP